MGIPSVTNTFANSTVADATAVNQNFTDIINALTDGTADLTLNSLTLSTAYAFTDQLVVTVNSAQLKLRYDTSGNTDCIWSVDGSGDLTVSSDGNINLAPTGAVVRIGTTAGSSGYGKLIVGASTQSEGFFGFDDANSNGTVSTTQEGWVKVFTGSSAKYIALYNPVA